MNEPPDQPYIIWALGAAFTATCLFIGFIFRSIAKAGREAEQIAEQVRIELVKSNNEVREELIRSERRHDEKIAAMHEENKSRYQEGREDRNAIRQEIRENHRIDMQQHDTMTAAVADLPMKLVQMLSKRDDG